MLRIKINKDRYIGIDDKPYIIAEIGSNHNGNIDLAKKIILQAKEAGADCVKFQSWSKDSIFSKKTYDDNYFLNDDYRDRDDYTLEQIVDEYSLSENQLLDLKKYCQTLQIDFNSTPFSKKEADFLVDELKVDFIKIASMDLNNYPFIKYLAGKNIPIFISTGLSTLAEIDRAIRTIENAGNNQIVILYCVSIYPPSDDQIAIKTIDQLSDLYSYPVGFSDHSIGTPITLAAAARGATVVEKHFTIDKEMEGWDHAISASPEELKEIVQGTNRIHGTLKNNRILRQESEERLNAFRRSIVAARDIKKDEIFTEDMLDFKRPGTGLEPKEIKYILGKKANRDISYDEIIQFHDF